MRKLIRRLDEAVPFPEPIYEFGARRAEGQGDRDIRPMFAGRQYVGCDFQDGPGVDRVLDLHALDLPEGSVGTAIALDTFEHVQQFWIGAEEIRRVLRPGGLTILSSVMYFPIDAHPGDYWRFTPEGFRELGRPFDKVLVEWAGLRDFPHTVVLVGARGELPAATEARLSEALADWRRHDAQSWKERVSLFLPPILLNPLYRWHSERAARKERGSREGASDPGDPR
jgi:SAM-dependent methyltransferase